MYASPWSITTGGEPALTNGARAAQDALAVGETRAITGDGSRITVTLLFTDIEGSTRLLIDASERYAEALEAHRRILRDAFAAGREMRTEGDSFFMVFASAREAVAGAVRAQRDLAAHAWPEGCAVRVRMGLHTGEATPTGADLVGLDVHRAARIAAAAHGGQILVSEATRAVIGAALPDGVGLHDLGEHRLKDLAQPERLYQVVADGLRAEFPPLRSLEATPNNLPLQLTSFVGRAREIDEAKRLLQQSHRTRWHGEDEAQPAARRRCLGRISAGRVLRATRCHQRAGARAVGHRSGAGRSRRRGASAAGPRDRTRKRQTAAARAR